MVQQNFKTNWKKSMHQFSSVQSLALMAVLIALKVIVSSMFIPVGENLHVGLSYLVVALQATLFGPAAGMIMAFVTDFISFALFPDGPFFIGYAFSAMLGIFIYAMCFYQKEITLKRIIIAKLLNNYLVNVLVGSLWSAMLYSKGYYFYFMKSLVKNTLLLPIEVLLIFTMFKLLIPILEKKNLIIKQPHFAKSSQRAS